MTAKPYTLGGSRASEDILATIGTAFAESGLRNRVVGSGSPTCRYEKPALESVKLWRA